MVLGQDLALLNIAPEVFDAAASWVELADFVPAVLAGVESPARFQRCICAAGHKALYSDAWGGLPPRDFLMRLHPALAALRDRLYDRAYPPDRPAGRLTSRWAGAVRPSGGHSELRMGGFDAHYGAIGAGVRPGSLVKIIGTSTCDCASRRRAAARPMSPESAGSFPDRSCPGCSASKRASRLSATCSSGGSMASVRETRRCMRSCGGEAERLQPGESGLVALDWNNGNRTVLVDPRLTGLIVGQTLHTTRAEIYRALIEATAFRRARHHRAPAGVWACRSIGSCAAAGGRGKKIPCSMADLRKDVLDQSRCTWPDLRRRRRSARRFGSCRGPPAPAAGGYSDRFEGAQIGR